MSRRARRRRQTRGEVGRLCEPIQTGKVSTSKLYMNNVNELVRGKRGITPESALLLSEYFRNSPEFWMNLQTAHDLSRARQEMRKRPGGITTITTAKARRRAPAAD